MNLRRPLLTLACVAAMCTLPVLGALSQGKYPSRPVRIIVPLPPGGAIDVFARAMGKEFEARTGGSVVIENRAGANTILAANACKTAAPDGYTFCILTRSTVSINPEIYRKLSYDPLKDFEPVTNGFFGQQIVILNKNVPVKTLAELVEYSRKNPDKLNFASMGLGGDSHLIMEWLKHETGAKINHVPYKGFPEAMTSFKANDVQMIALLVGNPDLARQIREGEVKGLLLPGSTRSNSRAGCSDICRVRSVGRRDQVHALVRILRAERHSEGIRRDNERRDQRDHGEPGVSREVPHVEGPGARGLQA